MSRKKDASADKAHMHAGIIVCGPEAGSFAVMSRTMRKRFGFDLGDFLYIASEDRDTCICRRLCDYTLPRSGTGDFIFMDKGSLELLNVDLRACLNVWKSDITFEMP